MLLPIKLFSKTYVQALIGRMCLDAAGYQTRRGDIKRVNGKGEIMTFETKGKENKWSYIMDVVLTGKTCTQ